MSPKEIIQKHARDSGDYIPDYHFKSLEKAMNEYALHIAEKAVEDSMNEFILNNEIKGWYEIVTDEVLSRIKKLTENK